MRLIHGTCSVPTSELCVTPFHVELVPDSYSDTHTETTVASCRLPVATNTQPIVSFFLLQFLLAIRSQYLLFSSNFFNIYY